MTFFLLFHYSLWYFMILVLKDQHHETVTMSAGHRLPGARAELHFSWKAYVATLTRKYVFNSSIGGKVLVGGTVIGDSDDD